MKDGIGSCRNGAGMLHVRSQGAAGVIGAILVLCAGTACAQEDEAEHGALVLEIGAAGGWPLSGERENFGGTIGLEVTASKNWLEIEAGFEALGTAGHTELSGDLLFKKPFRLTSETELMIGVGPSLARTINGPQRENELERRVCRRSHALVARQYRVVRGADLEYRSADRTAVPRGNGRVDRRLLLNGFAGYCSRDEPDATS
jgi:hypothetical protein